MPTTKLVKGANRLLSCLAIVPSRIYIECHFIILMTFVWLYSLKENLPLGQNHPSSLTCKEADRCLDLLQRRRSSYNVGLYKSQLPNCVVFSKPSELCKVL